MKLLFGFGFPAPIYQSHVRQRQLGLACIHNHFEFKLIFDENSEFITYILNFLSIFLTFVFEDESIATTSQEIPSVIMSS